MNSKTFELDFADGCLSGAEDVADRIEYALNNYFNLRAEADPKVLSDKYRITVTVELMHRFDEQLGGT